MSNDSAISGADELEHGVARTRVILAVDLDYFYAQCEEIRRPEIRGKPVVVCVYSGRTRDSGAVATANYVSRKLGVKSGIPIVSAKRTLKENPEAVFLPVDMEYYEAVSIRVMDILKSHSDRFEKVGIDEAFLDITMRCRRDYGMAEDMAKQVKKEIFNSESLTCSVGIAPNKLLAKMAADSRKPDGLTVLGPEQVHSFLDALPVGKLIGIGPKTEKKMAALGITTIGFLAKYDESRLAQEFGKNLGPQLRRMAQGIDEDEVKEREAEQIGRIVTLKKNATDFQFGDDLESLAKDISERLRAMNLLCKVVGIIAITTDLKTKTRARTLTDPTNSENEILSCSKKLFESFFESEPGAVVRRIGIRVSGLNKKAESPSAIKGLTLTDYLN